MTTASVKGDAITVRLDISHDMAETLRAYSEKHRISAEQAISYIVQNFLVEDSCMNSEPGPAVILDDDEYDYLEAEFKAGLNSVKSESDWISEAEMSEFIKSLKLNRCTCPRFGPGQVRLLALERPSVAFRRRMMCQSGIIRLHVETESVHGHEERSKMMDVHHCITWP